MPPEGQEREVGLISGCASRSEVHPDYARQDRGTPALAKSRHEMSANGGDVSQRDRFSGVWSATCAWPFRSVEKGKGTSTLARFAAQALRFFSALCLARDLQFDDRGAAEIFLDFGHRILFTFGHYVAPSRLPQ